MGDSNRGSVLARFRMWRIRRRVFRGTVLVKETVYPEGTFALSALVEAVESEFPKVTRFDV